YFFFAEKRQFPVIPIYVIDRNKQKTFSHHDSLYSSRGIMARSVTLYTIVLFLSVYLGPLILPVSGTILSSLCLVLAQGTENIYLSFNRLRMISQKKRRRLKGQRQGRESRSVFRS
ncbi:MAG: hypothetical protein ACLFST_07700, partial [Spirochaetia bacterium]